VQQKGTAAAEKTRQHPHLKVAKPEPNPNKVGFMEANEKRMAAALTAVMAYIQTEEEALVLPPPERPQPRRFEQGNLWALAGRQGMMQMRNLMQMKTFNRLR